MVDFINSLGNASGIDTQSLVSQLVQVEREPSQQRLDSRRERLDAQISAYGTLKSALSEFQGLISQLSNNDTFDARTVALPDTDVLTPNSLASGAQPGSYQLEVVSVAKSQSLALATQADSKTALGATGTLNIRFGDWSYSGTPAVVPSSFSVNEDRAALAINVTATDTLESIAKKITDTKSGVQANVLTVDGQSQLLLTAPSGASNAMEISVSDASLDDFAFNTGNYANVTETQQASDAQLKVNGLSVNRESNEIDDVIEGFNFTLNKSSGGETFSFTIEADTSVADQAVREFVEGYNSLYTTLKNLTGVTRDEDNNLVRGDLANDGAAKTIFERLRSLISATVPGLDGSGYNALTNIGIRTELDGTIAIDEDDYSTAFNQNFDLVQALFAPSVSSANPLVEARIGSAASAAVSGSYTIDITQDPSKGYAVTNALTGGESFNGGLVLFDLADNRFEDGSGVPTNLDASTMGDFSFKVKVNGTESKTITLDDSYANPAEMAEDIQAQINSDSKVGGTGAAVDVVYDSLTGQFTLTSRSNGEKSGVIFTSVSAELAKLGFSSSMLSITGKNVAGTVEGKAGFGSASVLLPPVGSASYGLNFIVQAGAEAADPFEVSFSQGFAGSFNQIISQFLSKSGVIAAREDTMDGQLDDIDSDQDRLDSRMEKYEARLAAQYLAMEQIISSLNTTSSSLDGILERLPFTAAKK